ncbi:MAG: hypothetical protein ABIP74_01170 [Candidatus Saccharimonas sp.]
MSEQLATDSNTRISTDDDRFGDVLPAADLDMSEPEAVDEHDFTDEEVRHLDAKNTIDMIANAPKVSVELGKRAAGLVHVIDIMSHISQLHGFLEGGKPKDALAVQEKIDALVVELNGALLEASGINTMVANGELSSLDAADALVQMRHGLRTKYTGTQNLKARERYVRVLKSQ